MQLKKNKWLWRCGFGIVALAVILLLVRQWILHGMPEDTVQIPPSEIEKQPEIPPRPGIQGIEISGPEIKTKRFEIDLSRSDLESLDWKRLVAVDPHTQIIVAATIDNQGNLSFSQRDVRMEGHPQAGVMITTAMRTWVYTPLKTGSIVFTFNLPSEGKKLLIDASGLRRKASISMEVPVLDGQLVFINGINPMEIRQISGTE